MKVHQKLKVISASESQVIAQTLDQNHEVILVNNKTGKRATIAEVKAYDNDRGETNPKKKKNLHLQFTRKQIKTDANVTVTIYPKFDEKVTVKPGDTITLTIN